MRKTVLYIAMSLDGFIADDRGGLTGCRRSRTALKMRRDGMSSLRALIRSSWAEKPGIR